MRYGCTLCQQLLSNHTYLGQKIFKALKIRIGKRLEKMLYTWGQFLNELDIFNNVSEDSLFLYASKPVISYAECLYNRSYLDTLL